MLLAVAVTLATPLPFVTTVGAERAAEAPLTGAANVTVTPLAGRPEASLMVTCSAFGKAVPTSVDCGRVGEAVITDADPDRLVRENVPATPRAVAVTDRKSTR